MSACMVVSVKETRLGCLYGNHRAHFRASKPRGTAYQVCKGCPPSNLGLGGKSAPSTMPPVPLGGFPTLIR